MNKDLTPLKPPVFEQMKKTDEHGEFWLSRDLSKILDYSEYRHFKSVLERAIEACKNSGHRVTDHFEGFLEKVSVGSGAQVEVENVRLSRYACYLIVQNASPDKEVVALGQTYFAVQTRMQELHQMEEFAQLDNEDEKRIFLRKELAEHNKKLASTAKGSGVIDPVDYAIFQNYGYKGLYGLDRKGIQRKKGMREKDNILDYMGSTELASNFFRVTQAEEKIRKDKIKTKTRANETHYEVGKKVRKAIEEIGGTMPEDLPAAENIKKIETKVNKQLNAKNEKAPDNSEA